MPAIRPEEALEKSDKEIPEVVFECWNRAIINNTRKTCGSISAIVKFSEIANPIMEKTGKSNDECQKAGWYDLERFYREAGWKVDTDSPAYNESYETTITFKKH